MSLPGFAGNISSCTQHSRRAAPLDPSPVMQSCAARLNARLLKQSVNCELLCKLLFIPVRVTLRLEAHFVLEFVTGRMSPLCLGAGIVSRLSLMFWAGVLHL